jgi:GNAT superfamily N-acetyltransferase
VRTFEGVDLRVRPLEPSDRERVRQGFERMSPESRYRRFLSPLPKLSDAQLTYLTEVDHHDHEALVAETADGDPVGIARFVRLADEPAAAEAAVAVSDDWQGHGVGTALVEELARRAREEAVEVFTATALADNEAAIDMLRRLGDAEVRPDGTGAVEMRIALDDDRFAALREALRRHASGALRLLHRN